MTPSYDMTPSPSGIVLIDKPRGMTSHDVVNRMRRVAGLRQVGHVGTLDPMADGLLIVCVGPATRIARFLVGHDKIYQGTITLGAMSSTYDAEGDIIAQDRPLPDDAQALREVMRRQVGERVQLPPPYSAIKVKGKKLYEYARNGEPVPQKPRNVRVMRFDLMHYHPPHIEFEARVGSGTYIRSMAHDLGLDLGCGAYLSQLRRTHIGHFSVEEAVPLETLVREPLLLPTHLLSLTEALGHLPKITVHVGIEGAILNGRPFTTRDILEFDGILTPGQPVLVINPSGRVLSIVTPEPEPPEEGVCEGGGAVSDAEWVLGATPLIFRPMRVFNRP